MQSTGDRIKIVLQRGESRPDVEVEFDWKESIAHPDNRCGVPASLTDCIRAQRAGARLQGLEGPGWVWVWDGEVTTAKPCAAAATGRAPRPPPARLQCNAVLDLPLLPCAPTARVEWELWFTTQDACGPACDSMRAFVQASGGGAAGAGERCSERLCGPCCSGVSLRFLAPLLSPKAGCCSLQSFPSATGACQTCSIPAALQAFRETAESLERVRWAGGPLRCAAVWPWAVH